MSQEMTEQEACGESSASDQWKTDWLARGVRVHRTAIVDKGARIGQGTTVWHHAHIRSTACIGETCVISKGVYIDAKVRIGSSCKIANGVQVYHGVVLGDGQKPRRTMVPWWSLRKWSRRTSVIASRLGRDASSCR